MTPRQPASPKRTPKPVRKARGSAPRVDLPNAEAAFDAWAQARMTSETNSLSANSVLKYRTVWTGWLRFLAAQQCEWHQAGPDLLRQYVDSINARGHGREEASYVSRRRYWRVLNNVYAHALKRGWVRANPGTEASVHMPRSETSAAVVLPPAYLNHLRKNLRKACTEPNPNWQRLRDQALLAVLLDAALTTGELCALRDSQVLHHGPSKSLVLRIDGQRAAQRRDLLLDTATAEIVRRWRKQRELVFPDPALRPDVLFTSKKRPGRLAPKSVFLLLQAQIAALEREQDSHIVHRGANVVRSSVIAEWLAHGVAASDVLARAGLDNARALQRLAHAAQGASLRSEPASSPS